MPHAPSPLLDDLHQRAEAARAGAYVPYSGFAVGTAVLTDAGDIFTGANVENASYGLTMCAERVALFSAVNAAAGRGVSIRALAIAGSAETLPPCGACRQVLAEFAEPDTEVAFSVDGSLRAYRASELLPIEFSPTALHSPIG